MTDNIVNRFLGYMNLNAIRDMHKTSSNNSVCYMFLQPKNVPKEYWMIHTRVEKMNSKGQQNNRYKIMIFKLYVPQLNCYFFCSAF